MATISPGVRAIWVPAIANVGHVGYAPSILLVPVFGIVGIRGGRRWRWSGRMLAMFAAMPLVLRCLDSRGVENWAHYGHDCPQHVASLPSGPVSLPGDG